MLSPSWLDRGKKYNIHDENISWHFQHRSKNSYFMWANISFSTEGYFRGMKKMKGKILLSDKLISLMTLACVCVCVQHKTSWSAGRMFQGEQISGSSQKECEKRAQMNRPLPGFQLSWAQGAAMYPRRSLLELGTRFVLSCIHYG